VIVWLLPLVVIFACGKKATPVPARAAGVGSADTAKKDGSSLSESLSLEWKEALNLPATFKGAVAHFIQISSDSLLLIDAERKSFLVSLTEKKAELLQAQLGTVTVDSGAQFFQTTAGSAWILAAQKLTHVQWDVVGTDVQTTEISTDKLFKILPSQPIKFSSPRIDSVLLSSSDESVFVKKKGSGFSLKSLEAKINNTLGATDFGHLFETLPEQGVRRLLESQVPQWGLHKISHVGLPATAVTKLYDVTGTPDAMQLMGVALAENKLWVSAPAMAGSTTRLSGGSSGSGGSTSDEVFTNEIAPLLVKYCGGCHEGRAPVFIKTEGSTKTVLKDAVFREKEKIKFRISLPESDARTMPPYAPRPSVEELKVLEKL
jgi:hypothetical protein